MTPGSGLAQRLLRLSGRGGVTGDAAKVHQVDHADRGIALRDLVQNGRRRAQALPQSAVLCGNGQPQQTGFAERVHRLFRKAALLIHFGGMGRDHFLANLPRFLNHGGLFFG